MRAIDKVYEKKVINANWINVVSGNQIGTITEEDTEGIYVSNDTLRQQLREDGFYTRMWGDDIQVARNPFNNY